MRKLAAMAVLAATFSAAPVAFAKKTKVSCGQLMTKSIRLANNLNCGPDENGLIVRGRNITLDLNGHTLTGDGTGEQRYDGISVDGARNVTIKNGTLRGWYDDVWADSTIGLTLKRLTLCGLMSPIRTERTRDISIRYTTMGSASWASPGGLFFDSDEPRFYKSRIRENCS